jgi:type I restriction enzyme S subunit
MESNWQEYSLSEIIELVIDNRGRNPSCYSNVGIPVIDNYLITSEGEPELSHVKRYIDNDIYNTFIRKYNQPGDVLLTLVGNGYGKVAISPKEQCIIIQNTIGLRTKSGFDNHFLYYILKGNRTSLTNLNRGAAQPSIKVGDILNLCFYFPSYEQQITIGNTLYQLDQKIRLNQQTNQTLEQMAQTLFKSWFIDFDPVFDNALAAGTNVSDFPEALQQRALLRQERRKQAQQLAASPKTKSKPLPDEIRNLFPSEFEQTDEPSIGINGWIPKGWESCSMSEIVDIASSKRVFAKDYVEEGVPFFRGKEITQLSQGIKINTEIFISEEKYQELKEKAGAPKQGDILITSVGTIGNTYLVKESDKFYFKDGNLTWIKSYKKGFIPFYMKEWFSSKQGKDAIERIKIGTTQQAITIKALNGIVILSPEDKVVQVFENHAASIFDKHDANIEQIDNLSKLRNTLLPKLISGELTIPDTIKTENNANHQQPKEPLSHHA